MATPMDISEPACDKQGCKERCEGSYVGLLKENFIICFLINDIKKLGAVVLGLQNDELTTRTERAESFIADAQNLLQQLDSPLGKDYQFFDWLFGSLKKIAGDSH